MCAEIRAHELRKYLDTKVVENRDGRHLNFFLKDSSALSEALTAFAEIVVARLRVSGAFISLTDGHLYRCLAGSTNSKTEAEEEHGRLSPRWLGNSDTDMEKWLWLGRQTLEWKQTTNRYRSFVVTRLDLDQHLNTLSPVINSPYLRFYAAAPVTTKLGITIGNIFVVDNAEGKQMLESEQNFLFSMAQKCMSQLEIARECALRLRGTRLAEGLASLATCRSVSADMLQDPPSFHSREQPMSPTRKRGTGHSSRSSSTQLQKGGYKTSSRNQQNPKLGQASRDVAQSQIREYPESNRAEPDLGNAEEGTEISDDGKTGETIYQKIFQRAADHLKSSFEVEGVIFLDGIMEFHGTLLPVGVPNHELQHEARQTGHATTPREQQNARLDEEVQDRSLSAFHQKRSCDSTTGPARRIFTSSAFQKRFYTESPAEILGASVDTNHAEAKQTEASKSTPGLRQVDEGFLQHFMEDHPEGKLWYFDKEIKSYHFVGGALTVNTIDRGVEQLPPYLPGVRQILYSPIIDPVTFKYLAGCIAWTTKVFPVFTEASDLVPFQSFLHTIGAEISRIDTVAAIKQQKSFVASISHELRTPLHGILGTVELLQGTELDSIQQGLADNIRSSGSILHSTLGSVLSFAKINQFEGKQNKPQKEGPSISPWARVDNVTSSERDGDFQSSYVITNVAILCEEVVDATVGGHAHYKTPSDDSPIITLDIAYQKSWYLVTEPGALRRIIINLIGNAMKYTTQGFVKISLNAEHMEDEHEAGWEGTPMKVAVFTISDSGQGMSREFVDEHLFVPFRQEDSIGSQGLGLGMSMVKSLVALLGGEIEVRSEQGKGSEIRVSLPMVVGERDTGYDSSDAILLQQDISYLRNKQINVAMSGLVPSVTQSLQDYLSGWFHCGILSKDLEGTVIPDLIVAGDIGAELIDEISHRYPQGCLALLKVSRDLSSQIHSATAYTGYKYLVTVSQPLGPRKLTKALLSCLEKPQSLQMPEDKNLGTASGNAGSVPEKHRSSGPIINSANPSILTSDRRTVNTQFFRDHSQPSEKLDSSSMTATSRKPARLLLVDDNEINLSILRMFVVRNGYDNIETAKNGAMALEAVKSCTSGFDIIFMDMSMPVMDGFEATRVIRQLEAQRITSTPSPQPSLPSSSSFPIKFPRKSALVVALTGLASSQQEEKAYQAGVNLFLTKPIEFGKLERLLREWESGAP